MEVKNMNEESKKLLIDLIYAKAEDCDNIKSATKNAKIIKKTTSIQILLYKIAKHLRAEWFPK